MSRLNRRFLMAESPHNHLRLIIASVIVFLLVFLALIYFLIRRLTRTSPSSSSPSQRPSRELLRGLPVIIYDKQKCKTEAFEGVCAICLVDYENGERLRTMPCNHVFHRECVDKWLMESGQCPVCRRVVVNLEQIKLENARRCSERLMAAYSPSGGVRTLII